MKLPFTLLFPSALVIPQSPVDCSVGLTAICDKTENALVRVVVEDDASTKHVSTSIVLTIDESGSMGQMATMHDDSDGASGLTVLDIVKHASRTVLGSLAETDRFGIVAFSDTARIVLPLKELTLDHRWRAEEAIESLYPRSSTNLYDGLIHACDLVASSSASSATFNNNHVMLLTDGMPNVSPPRGELASLRRYLDNKDGLSCSIATFGFGYSLDSHLLHDIAVLGKSQYAFIPDSSFVGTVFVHATANALSTALPPSTLRLEAAPGVQLSSSLPMTTETSWGLSIALPPLLYGQNYNVLVKVGGTATNGEAPFRATCSLGGEEIEADWDTTNYGLASSSSHHLIAEAVVREAIVNLIYKCVDPGIINFDSWLLGLDRRPFHSLQTKAVETVTAIKATIPGNTTAHMSEMENDLLGQVEEALSRSDWYSRWGVHYLLSLARSHVVQWCFNFKDPGPQAYATKKFSAIRDISEDLFVKLPPPKPSRTPRKFVMSMSTFHDSGAPCFASGLVEMADKSRKDVSKLRAGDWVATPEGRSKVVCVVETLCAGGVEALVELPGGVLITPWHPVQQQVTGDDSNKQQWQFPCDIASPSFHFCEKVFSVVLEDGSSAIRIGNFNAVSLGHGRSDQPILQHSYLGTDRVIEDLKAMHGWEQGYIQLGSDPLVRDKASGLAVGLRQQEPVVIR